jgi:glycosyltransferase involved in cell wall biosynthesis
VRCIQSILAQDYPRDLIEAIVVDNYSPDGTAAIARSLGVQVLEKGPERNAQRQHGASRASGEYIMFIDADMELEPTLVSEGVRLCGEAGFDAVILPERSVGSGFWAAVRALEKRCYLEDSTMETPNRFIKREVYHAVDGYDPLLIVGEDFDLGDRIAEAGYSVGRTTAFIAHHEVLTFIQMLRKHYYYGSQMPQYLRKSRGRGVKRFFILRRAYLRNWREFLRNPLLGGGLVLMKALQYAFGTVGFATGVFAMRKRRGMSGRA